MIALLVGEPIRPDPRQMKRWETQQNMSTAVRSILKAVIILVVFTHWMACLWGFVRADTRGHILELFERSVLVPTCC